MSQRLGTLIITCLIALPSFSQTGSSLETLQQQISATLHQEKGNFAVAFKDLSTGKEVLIDEHELFHAASTMKTPVLIEVYKQLAKGKFRMSDEIELKNEFRSIADTSTFSLSPADDSEFELYKHIGEKRRVDSLVYLMITVSSNFATNLLIDLVGAKNVTQTMRDLGAKDIQVLRGVEDGKAYQKGMNNLVTAYDLMLIFEQLAKGKAVSPRATQAMIQILLDQQFREIIPAGVPANVRVAHKTGFFKGVHHDSGIVFLPDGRKYVLVILSKNIEDEDHAVHAMASVSTSIYKYMNP